MRTLIFCDKEILKKGIAFIEKGLLPDGERLYVAMDTESFRTVSASGRAVVSIDAIGNRLSWSPEKTQKDLVSLISRFRIRISETEKPLAEVFALNGISYWDIIEGPLVCYKLYPIVFILEICHEFLNDSVKEIILPSKDRTAYRVIYHYAISRNISIRILKNPKIQKKIIQSFKNDYFPWIREALYLAKLICHRKTPSVPELTEKISGKYRVLFLCFFSRQMDSIWPVLKKLQKDQSMDCILMLASGATGKDILKKEGTPFLLLEDILEKMSTPTSRIMNFKRWSQWREFFQSHDKDFPVEYQGTNISPLILDEVFSYVKPFLFNLSDLAAGILRQMAPDLIIQVDDANILNRSFLNAGKSLDIPTLHLQYGMMSEQAVDWLVNRADRIAVFGSYFKDILVKAGINEKRITVSGQSRYDELSELKRITNSKHPAKGRGDSKRIKVLFSSVPFFNEESDFHYGYAAFNENEYLIHLKALYSQVSKMDNVELVVKLHPNPNDRQDYHLKVLSAVNAGASNIHFKPRSMDIFSLLIECQALITHHSTTAIEAMILGKPVFILNLTGRKDPIDYTRGKAAVGIYSEEAIGPALQDVLFSKEKIEEMLRGQQEFLRERYIPLYLSATDNVVNLINEMLPQRP